MGCTTVSVNRSCAAHSSQFTSLAANWIHTHDVENLSAGWRKLSLTKKCRLQLDSFLNRFTQGSTRHASTFAHNTIWKVRYSSNIGCYFTFDTPKGPKTCWSSTAKSENEKVFFDPKMYIETFCTFVKNLIVFDIF